MTSYPKSKGYFEVRFPSLKDNKVDLLYILLPNSELGKWVEGAIFSSYRTDLTPLACASFLALAIWESFAC